MKKSAIVAMSKNRVIGYNNQIPWYLPNDLKLFKKITINHHIIMGRKTFLSIGRPLPKRTNIVLTRNPFFTASGVHIMHSIEESISIAERNGEEEVFIIGGAEIYNLSLPLIDRIYISEVDIEPIGDTFFPVLEETEWEVSSSKFYPADEKNEHAFLFKKMDRI